MDESKVKIELTEAEANILIQMARFCRLAISDFEEYHSEIETIHAKVERARDKANSQKSEAAFRTAFLRGR